MTPELTKRLFTNFLEAVRNTIRGGPDESDDAGDADGGGDGRPAVYLAAFGKHPGWDDHVDDMGLETQLLVWAKRLLYTDGIAGNIDAGSWEKLSAADRLDKFDHTFIWKTGRALIVGRLWSSTDGKGRARYPMVLAAQCSGLPAAWVLANVPQRLEELHKRCVATRSADDVRAAVDACRRELREAALAQAPAAATSTTPNAVDALVTSPAVGQDHRGLLSVMYEVKTYMGAFLPASDDADVDSKAGAASSHHLRVPLVGSDPYLAMLQWIEFLGMQLDPAAPILAVHPFGHAWVDVTVGEPTSAELFSIRASPKKQTYVTDIPYNMTAQFIRESEAFLAKHRSSTPADVR